MFLFYRLSQVLTFYSSWMVEQPGLPLLCSYYYGLKLLPKYVAYRKRGGNKFKILTGVNPIIKDELMTEKSKTM